jgi:hypothetical protein
MKKLYQNTFEIFGDCSPARADNEREYAQAYLPMFATECGQYIVEAPMRGGFSHEAKWTRDVWDAASPIAGADPENEDYRLIDEDALLDFLVRAVEEAEDTREKSDEYEGPRDRDEFCGDYQDAERNR